MAEWQSSSAARRTAIFVGRDARGAELVGTHPASGQCCISDRTRDGFSDYSCWRGALFQIGPLLREKVGRGGLGRPRGAFQSVGP